MCDRKCDCKTCLFSMIAMCGDCYVDSLEQCRSGGIHDCEGYIPRNFLKRLWRCITGKSSWDYFNIR